MLYKPQERFGSIAHEVRLSIILCFQSYIWCRQEAVIQTEGKWHPQRKFVCHMPTHLKNQQGSIHPENTASLLLTKSDESPEDCLVTLIRSPYVSLWGRTTSLLMVMQELMEHREKAQVHSLSIPGKLLS